MKLFSTISSFFLLLIVSSCTGLIQKKTNIDIRINPQDTGWYFLELVKDAAEPPVSTIEIQFDTSAGLPQVPIKGIENYNFRVFSHNGEKLSAQIKMPAFVYHTSGHQFFRFYNPSALGAANELNWNKSGAYMERLREQSIITLNRLLNMR